MYLLQEFFLVPTAVEKEQINRLLRHEHPYLQRERFESQPDVTLEKGALWATMDENQNASKLRKCLQARDLGRGRSRQVGRIWPQL